MSFAINFAAHTTAPATWTTPAGTTATVEMPTGLHVGYASEAHTNTVVQLAETPQTAPASVPGAIGLTGATLIGLGLIVWTAAKWRSQAKEVKRAFVLGAIATLLVGSWGLFGTVGETVKTTGDSVGTSLGNTVGQSR